MIKNNLSKLMGEKRIKMAELERLADLSESTVRRLYHNTTSTVGFRTISKLCWALDCTVNDILEYVED